MDLIQLHLDAQSLAESIEKITLELKTAGWIHTSTNDTTFRGHSTRYIYLEKRPLKILLCCMTNTGIQASCYTEDKPKEFIWYLSLTITPQQQLHADSCTTNPLPSEG